MVATRVAIATVAMFVAWRQHVASKRRTVHEKLERTLMQLKDVESSSIEFDLRENQQARQNT